MARGDRPKCCSRLSGHVNHQEIQHRNEEKGREGKLSGDFPAAVLTTAEQSEGIELD
jgi:hypothetical protein